MQGLELALNIDAGIPHPSFTLGKMGKEIEDGIFRQVVEVPLEGSDVSAFLGTRWQFAGPVAGLPLGRCVLLATNPAVPPVGSLELTRETLPGLVRFNAVYWETPSRASAILEATSKKSIAVESISSTRVGISLSFLELAQGVVEKRPLETAIWELPLVEIGAYVALRIALAMQCRVLTSDMPTCMDSDQKSILGFELESKDYNVVDNTCQLRTKMQRVFKECAPVGTMGDWIAKSTESGEGGENPDVVVPGGAGGSAGESTLADAEAVETEELGRFQLKSTHSPLDAFRAVLTSLERIEAAST